MRRTVAGGLWEEVAILAALLLPTVRAAAAQEFWLPAPEDSLAALVRADSNDPVAHHLVALAHLNRRRLDDAERALREALVVDPRYAPAHLGLAVVMLQRHAEVFLPPWMARTRKRLSRHQLDSLVQVVSARVRTAVLLDPLVDLTAPDAPSDTATPRPAADNAGFARLWEYARATARQGRFEPGVRVFGLLIKRSWKREHADSTHPFTYLVTNDFRYLEAYWRERAGRLWEAEQGYRQVLGFDLGFWMVHRRLADLFERRGRMEESLAERQEAVFLNPDDPMLLVDLARTFGRMGRLEEADSAYAAAEVRLPRYPLIPYHRGQIAWLRGDAAGAREAFERFLVLAPSCLARQIEDARVSLLALP